MGELAAADVEAFTNGRLEDDGETNRMLNAALAVARRYAGWFVSPVVTGDVVIVDGPGGSLLQLPTRRLTALTAVTEDGNTLDVTKLEWASSGSVRKQSCRCWSRKYRAIHATMTHGYNEIEAADWRQAILTMVDQMSLLPVAGASGRSAADLTYKRVDDVQYQWSDAELTSMAEKSLLSVTTILDSFQLIPVMLV